MNWKKRIDSSKESILKRLSFLKKKSKDVKEHRLSGRELKLWHAFSISLIIGILIFIFFVNFSRDCGTDQACFLEASQGCRGATVNVEEEGNLFTYTIVGNGEDACIIDVKATEIGPGANSVLFSGKGMVCEIPKSVLQEYLIGDVPGLIDYCSGELKEAMYEFIISKLYGTIAQNLGEIISDIGT